MPSGSAHSLACAGHFLNRPMEHEAQMETQFKSDANSTDPNATVLEARFPHVASAIQLLWGNPEMDTYFSKLVVDDRGNREGFPPEVMSDLKFLAALHQAAYRFGAKALNSKACAYDNSLNYRQAGGQRRLTQPLASKNARIGATVSSVWNIGAWPVAA